MMKHLVQLQSCPISTCSFQKFEFVADGCEEFIFAWRARSEDLHGSTDGFLESRSS